jgi:outer membrane protein OmpA-like peptidoglycan-associated protein
LVFDRTSQIRIDVPSTNDDEGGSLLTDIRVAEGGKPLYDALAANGRVSTHGILFATGSATIEGESTPTLQEIADMLTTHPDLKLLIEGHTDNVGSAAANQALSEQRAAAVKQYLVSKNGIAAARLQTKGYGASKPAASNDTPAGRQQNRRVELVRM